MENIKIEQHRFSLFLSLQRGHSRLVGCTSVLGRECSAILIWPYYLGLRLGPLLLH
jgi:hypothetical protein